MQVGWTDLISEEPELGGRQSGLRATAAPPSPASGHGHLLILSLGLFSPTLGEANNLLGFQDKRRVWEALPGTLALSFCPSCQTWTSEG